MVLIYGGSLQNTSTVFTCKQKQFSIKCTTVQPLQPQVLLVLTSDVEVIHGCHPLKPLS